VTGLFTRKIRDKRSKLPEAEYRVLASSSLLALFSISARLLTLSLLKNLFRKAVYRN
jgi:hypothetical protein